VAAPCSQWIACSPVRNGSVVGRSTRSLGVTEKMPGFDIDEFLNRKHFAFSFGALIGDVEDLLELSELNIEWQRRSAIQAIHRTPDLDSFPEGYLDHLLTNAEHRFTTSLPMRLRYASLLALVTTVEWEARVLCQYAVFPIEKKPGNKTVHILRSFESQLILGFGPTIDDYENLVFVRNAVAHNSGVAPGYEFNGRPLEAQLREAVDKLNGFSITNWHFIGDCVKIERGALLPYIRAMGNLLPRMWEEADKRGKVKQ